MLTVIKITSTQHGVSWLKFQVKLKNNKQVCRVPQPQGLGIEIKKYIHYYHKRAVLLLE